MPAAKPTAFVMWEYRTITLDSIWEQKEKILNELGKEGWELVSVDDNMAYLKRNLGTYIR